MGSPLMQGLTIEVNMLRLSSFKAIGNILLLCLCQIAAAVAAPAKPEMLIYCGITMIRPMTEISRMFE